MRPAIRSRCHPQSPAPSDAGFSLLELLVYITIVGLLIGMVGPALMRQLGSARTSVAHQSIERLASVLDMYKLDVGTYPTTEQGLEALLQEPTDVSNWNGPTCRAPNCRWTRGTIPTFIDRRPAGRTTATTFARKDHPATPAAIR